MKEQQRRRSPMIIHVRTKTLENASTRHTKKQLDSHKNQNINRILPVQAQNLNIVNGHESKIPLSKATISNLPDKTKKSIYSPRCIIISGVITSIIVLGIMALSLTLLIKNLLEAKTRKVPLLRWNLSGITIAGIANMSGNGSNQFNEPYDAILDYEYNLYVTDRLNCRIQKYGLNSLTGKTIIGNGTLGSSSSQLYHPIEIVRDSNGGFYIADSANHRVQYWANGAIQGTTVAGSGLSAGSSTDKLNYPYGVALNPILNELYVSDKDNHRIISFAFGNTNGTVMLGGNGPGYNNTQLRYPTGVYFDSFSNNLVVSNVEAHNIVQFTPDVNMWTIVAGNINGSAGKTSTEFQNPFKLTFDPMGNMYVADFNNHRIQFFNANQKDGITIAGFSGASGSNATTLYGPRSARLDNQLNLYVADSKNHRIQKFLRY